MYYSVKANMCRHFLGGFYQPYKPSQPYVPSIRQIQTLTNKKLGMTYKKLTSVPSECMTPENLAKVDDYLNITSRLKRETLHFFDKTSVIVTSGNRMFGRLTVLCETKPNETLRNKTKQNRCEMKPNETVAKRNRCETKPNEIVMKWNQTKLLRNETAAKRNQTKLDFKRSSILMSYHFLLTNM